MLLLEELMRDSLLLVLITSGAVLLGTSSAGVLVAVLQAATQVQEQTVTFCAKFIAFAIIAYFGCEILWHSLLSLWQRSFSALPAFGQT